jgi:hypothetical protein
MNKNVENLQLPDLSKDYRGLLNAARSALFKNASERERKEFKDELIKSYDEVNIFHTGQELRQDDEYFFLQVLYLAKKQGSEENISFSAKSMLALLGRTNNTSEYDRLVASLRRMTGMLLKLSVRLPGGSYFDYGGSLISNFELLEKNAGDKNCEKWSVSLTVKIVNLFDSQ